MSGDIDDGAVTFVWDVFFAAVMFGLAGRGNERAKDIAYANVITTVFSRTVTGMVPNYRTGDDGMTATYDRTEPMVGSWSLQILHDVFGDGWVAELLFPALLGWNDWVHERRSAEGSLALKELGGKTALVSLGSDATVPAGLNTPHTLAACRYESGLDNSPQYDGKDSDSHEQFGAGPVQFNASTSHMELYDVAFTVYHALDSQALLALSSAADASAADVAKLKARAAATETALHRDLFDAGTGQYANRLYNGTFYKRWAPTIFAPMLLNSTPASRIPKMAEMMGDSSTFCVSASPGKVQHEDVGEDAVVNVTILWRMQADTVGYMAPGQSITCASEACLQSTLLDVAEFGGIEAIVDEVESTGAPLPLQIYRATSGSGGDQVLSTKSPGIGYVIANASAAPEGWCAPAATKIYAQPLMLWYSNTTLDHRTCGGTADCADVQMDKIGYEKVNNGAPLCFAKSAVDVGSIPCRYVYIYHVCLFVCVCV